jgi:prepilin-type processing-associated H-X9-DG protein
VCGDHHQIGWWHGNSLWTATAAPINFKIRCMGDQGYNANPTDCTRHNVWTTSQGFKSRHPGGAQFVFCDGSIHFLSETIDYRNYQRLGSRRDGEPVAEY